MALRGVPYHALIGQKTATSYPASYQLLCSLVRSSGYIPPNGWMSVNKDLEEMLNEEMAVGHTISSSVDIARGSELKSWGLTPSRGRIFLFFKASRLTVGPIHPPIQWVWGGGINLPGVLLNLLSKETSYCLTFF
jgi:hypothetical protein